ncbi:MAG: twin-arginine translocase subunit TatC [Selenomonadaceae bacterium]|nr:twin-arginine translocase subunit TatC [Selenomonadaceae bacterium]
MSETGKNIVAEDGANAEKEISEEKDKEVSEYKENEEEDIDEGNMSLVKHLEELRNRIIKSLLAVLLGSVVSYYFIGDIMRYLTLPVGKLYYLQPSEAFFTYLKVAVAAGFLLALPVVFYHVWRFFLPALTRSERQVIAMLVPISVLLFFIGLAFSFFFVLPAAVKFFMGFGGEDLQAMFSVDRYFDFVLTFVLPFGFVFELPLAIVILGKMGIIGSAFLERHHRTVIFLSFIIAAIITPTPDVFTQSMLALPMILLYEVGFLIVKYMMRK